MGSPLRVTTAAGVRRIEIDVQATRNALSRRVVSSLTVEVRSAEADPGVRVVVLTGAGSVFCSGGDLKESAGLGPGDHRPQDLIELYRSLSTLVKPTLARVNGHAIGGGLGLAAACDFVIATRQARMGLVEVRLGGVASAAVVPCARRLSHGALLRLALTGELIDADEAAAIGLIDRAVPEDDLDSAVHSLCSELVAGGPEAMRLTKAHIGRIADRDMELLYAHAPDIDEQVLGSAEQLEGIAAMRERRPPAWVPPQDLFAKAFCDFPRLASVFKVIILRESRDLSLAHVTADAQRRPTAFTDNPRRRTRRLSRACGNDNARFRTMGSRR
jgi:methylglutaconyl-CoA hydratase